MLVAESNIPRGQWPLGRIVDINVGRDGDVRSCVIRTRTSQIVRPITYRRKSEYLSIPEK